MELKIEGITKEFKETRAVNNISYTMENGVYGLLGVNGAGKTTLMRMLCTLLRPTSGQITCNGKDIFDMGADYRNLLGYLPQEFGFYPDFTVKDYLLYIASIKGIKSAVTNKVIKELLMQVGLEKEQNKKMKKLSGGMKRRVGIAQAIMNNPRILILDEPTAGLDPNERIRFRNLISELAQERIILLSTHIVSDVEYIANDILLMKNGEILHSGTHEEIVSSVPTKTWIVEVEKAEMNAYTQKYKIANIKTVGEKVEIRILSEGKPDINAREEIVTLEDVFLYYFGERMSEEDAVL